jgi:hypothetical protein
MNAPYETTQPESRFLVFELGRVATLPSEKREAEPIMVVERLSIHGHRRDQRNLCFSQFGGERMFFENLFIAPATRAIKFGDQRNGIFDPYLVDPVFITVQSQ